ncbi:hypothetical protein [Flavobacterium sp. TSSA_36]|uniref:hypothetical protein n=1 Tax=Flavobacterium sp. TSSA_36 TaxID=3447669 RepID=UPI003F3FA09A
MKSIKLFFIATILFAISANSQITKGNWMVGGSGNFESSSVQTNIKGSNTTSTETGKSLFLQPNVGYLIVDKFAVGLSPSFSIGRTNKDKNITSYAIGGFARYYLLKPEKLINIITQIEYSYSPPQRNASFENLGFKTGPTLFFTDNVALELTLNYKITKFESDFSSSKWKTFNISMGFQIHLKK